MADRFSPRGAFVYPGEGASSSAVDGLEGFARTFLLASFRLSGAGGAGPSELAERYSRGLAEGTDASSGEAWPAIRSRRGPIVEAASLAVALWASRPWVWDQLDPSVQERVAAWLGSVNGKECWPNNWLLFPVVVNAFLKSVGAPHRQSAIERNLDRIDGFYRADGWYTDGAGRNYDHYTGWGFHYYTALWCRMGGEADDPGRAAVYRERIHRFLEDYRYLFGGNGAPLHQGRSLIYRFATAAALWAGALIDASPLAPGETRRVASGAVRYFLERGALRDGRLTAGWHGQFDGLAQAYSGPASPYWASKAFLGLVIPATAPVWTDREEPLPVERNDFVRPLPEPGFLAWGTTEDGIVRVANAKADHYPLGGSLTSARPLYWKLAYSTHAGPEMGDFELDSQVALVAPDGAVHGRRRFHCLAVADRFAASAYYPLEWADTNETWSRRIGRDVRRGPARVEIATIAYGQAEIRLIHVRAPGAWGLRTGGFALASDDALETETGERWSRARRTDGLTTAVVGLAGFESAEIHLASGVNAFGEHSATPLLTREQAGRETVSAALIVLAGPSAADRALADPPALEVGGRCVTIECPSGDRFFVQLGEQETIERRLEGLVLSGRIRYARASPDGSSFVLRSDGRSG